MSMLLTPEKLLAASSSTQNLGILRYFKVTTTEASMYPQTTPNLLLSGQNLVSNLKLAPC